MVIGIKRRKDMAAYLAYLYLIDLSQNQIDKENKKLL